MDTDADFPQTQRNPVDRAERFAYCVVYLPPDAATDLSELARRQHAVMSRAQLLDCGLNQFEIRAQLAAGRWQRWGAHQVVLHNSVLSRTQLMWAATLDAGPPSALASHTALELHGFRSFAKEASAIHLLVERGAKMSAGPAIVVHESRRVGTESHVRVTGLPCTDIPRSALDAAAWQPWPRFACALVAAVVQQRLCRPSDLEHALQRVGRIRHKAHLRLAIRDIAGGAEALSEIDLGRICARFGLQPPARQVLRRDGAGRIRYLDAEWLLPDGRRVVLEVDGAHHLEVEHWQDDMRRDRSLVVRGAQVLRATAVEVRLQPAEVVRDLVAIGVPVLSDPS